MRLLVKAKVIQDHSESFRYKDSCVTMTHLDHKVRLAAKIANMVPIEHGCPNCGNRDSDKINLDVAKDKQSAFCECQTCGAKYPASGDETLALLRVVK